MEARYIGGRNIAYEIIDMATPLLEHGYGQSEEWRNGGIGS